jgi:hypothetical protein
MRVLTEDAVLVCKHQLGHLGVVPTQALVTIAGRRVLLAPDPEGRPIVGCPLTMPFKPCLTSLRVQTGYSDFIRVLERALCLDTVSGFTDGTPPGTIRYEVRAPGQDFVRQEGA